MPVGKVRFYDAEKGFGFLVKEDGGDVYVRANVLPPGVTSLKTGQKVEFGVVEGRKGAQAMQLRVIDPAPSVQANRRERDRKPTEDMVVIVEDLIKLLDNVSEGLRRGHYPDKGMGTKLGQLLRGVAADLEA